MKKYVVLEHILAEGYIGMRFWSTNSANCEYLYDGRKAYRKVMETDSPEEAKEACGFSVPPALPEDGDLSKLPILDMDEFNRLTK